jgi:predicted AAA+ superfamily ATPase
LWEQLVLEHLQACWPDTPARYWRDKAGNEIDFVLPRNREAVDAIECKWNPQAFDATALALFRSYYPKGRNYLVTPLEGPAYRKRFTKLEVKVCGPEGIEG